MDRITDFFKSPTLQTVTAIPFILLLLLTVGIVGYLSYKTSNKSVNVVVDQLLFKISNRIYEKLDTYLEIPHQVNRAIADDFHTGIIDLNDNTVLERYLLNKLLQFDLMYGSAIASRQDEYIGCTRFEGKISIDIAGKKTGNVLEKWYVDHSGRRTRLYQEKSDYFPSKRPWFQASLKNEKSAWSSVYLTKTQRIAVTASRPLLDSEGNILAVAATGIRLEKISEFLNSLAVGKTGMTFIVERSGLLIASSDLKQKLVVKEADDTIKRIKAVSSQQSLIKPATRQLLEKFGDYNQVMNPQKLKIHIGNEVLSLFVDPYIDKRGINWLIVVLIPDSDFLEQIKANQRSVVLIYIASLAIAIFISVLISRWITQPVKLLNSAAKKITRGDWGEPFTIERSDEIGELSQSFNKMANQLKGSFNTLEKRVKDRTHDLDQSNQQLKQKINERKQVETELIEAKTELETVNQSLEKRIADEVEKRQKQQQILIQRSKLESLGVLAAGLAHEVNQPLAGISMGLDNMLFRLENDPTDLDYCKNKINVIMGHIERITSLLQHVRLFSRDQFADRFEKVHMREVLKNALGMLSAQYEQQGIRIQVNDTGFEGSVLGHPFRLEQVLLNLITNAADALAKKEKQSGAFSIDKRIDIRLISTASTIRIEVIDNGIGISETNLPKIFDPFFTTKDPGRGTGLGLSICYGILKDMGGDLVVESNACEYTLMRVSLPRMKTM